MIKVSIIYPNGPEARFDHDYYRNQHLPLIQRRMGAAQHRRAGSVTTIPRSTCQQRQSRSAS